MSELKLFNTLTRKTETFQPLVPGSVRMYCCGPTVYSYAHIGNLRTFLWGDLLRRYLEWKGFKVTMVMNLTDIDDRIIQIANEKGVDINTHTAPFIEAFYGDLDTLRIRRADIYPRATQHIDDMVQLVERLGANGHTYVVEGSTYYRIATFPDYGKLSQIPVATESTVGQSRIDTDRYEKEDARDFVLWKAKKEGEPSWNAPIGEGRPGWHLECSAMSMRYLGETFDIHTGGVDLVFPHHENEVAQSEGATDLPFVKYWIHGEHLIVEDQKMSKSLGNVYTLSELIERGFTPLQIRYALLSVPHRTKLNFAERTLEDARHAVERVQLFMLRLNDVSSSKQTAVEGVTDRGKEMIHRFLTGFEEAMDDDLNTAAALGSLFTLIRDTNIAIDEGTVSAADCEAIAAAVRRADQVFDILPAQERETDEEIDRMIEARNEARRQRKFDEADRLRDELTSRGIILEDTPGGTRWRRKM
ncbi:MAG: cysteine--tRNA ligase [Thermoanaerobaculia bacterium]